MTEIQNKIAAIQMASGPNVGANLLEAERLVVDAADAGAGLVVLPENFAFMGETEQDKLALRERDGEGPMQDFLAQIAKRLGIWLVGGTVPLEADDPNKIRAACMVYDDQGKRVARYDKIHLFDVNLVEANERYSESETIEPGEKAVVLDTPFGRLGIAVCYDLRFPEMFRHMLDEGMDILALPASFTAITGKAHWEILVRARAVENLCYMIAAAQGGFHINGRETYGHSMIVGPWGTLLAELPSGAGAVTAPLDIEGLRSIRRSFPALDHRQLYCRL
ncbi:MAG: carbon-nitrogen hydrolase family protein [Candidatus Polarisedimenticolaceae bacterium]|nr:carbon-nitrogen hydrolase family protein [Candidatus Polarisedimenticolaceae bacterium]